MEEADPRIKRVLTRLVEAKPAADPMTYLLWTNKSMRTLAEELARHGFEVSDARRFQLYTDPSIAA